MRLAGRRLRTAFGCLLILVAGRSWLLQSELTTHEELAAVPATRVARASVLLITSAIKCTAPRGSYFVTKALQTKMQLARKHGWGIWVSGEEGWAASEYSTLSNPAAVPDLDQATVGPAAEAAALLLQAQQSASVGLGSSATQWLLWIGATVFIVNPEASDAELPWGQLDIGSEAVGDSVHLLLSSATSSSEGLPRTRRVASDEVPDIDSSVILLRVHEWSRAFLSAWLDDLTRDGGPNPDFGDPMHRLLASSRWRQHVRVERPGFVRTMLWPHTDKGTRELDEGVDKEEAGRSLLEVAPTHKGERDNFTNPPFALNFGECAPCRSATAADAQSLPQTVGRAACERAMMRAFTAADDTSLTFLGAEHAALGSVHVRPILERVARERSTGAGKAPVVSQWLSASRGGLGRCLPRLIVVGSQRAGLASLHWLLRHGWHRDFSVVAGERESHFFSMDNRHREGTLAYQRRFFPNSTQVQRVCST